MGNTLAVYNVTNMYNYINGQPLTTIKVKIKRNKNKQAKVPSVYAFFVTVDRYLVCLSY